MWVITISLIYKTLTICSIIRILDNPDLEGMPGLNADKETKRMWLLEISKKLVKKYALHTDIGMLADKTSNLDDTTRDKFECRMEGCNKSYVFHSRRVR